MYGIVNPPFLRGLTRKKTKWTIRLLRYLAVALDYRERLLVRNLCTRIVNHTLIHSQRI